MSPQSNHRVRPAQQTQPRTYKLSIRSLLALPFRICNPPAAVGKVRSCGVTPVFNVRLEDVLDRKHLPPLGLKDFEEWLLYVELSAENLYFTLWLREYTIRYKQWSKSHRQDSRHFGAGWIPQSSSQLAMFYARAKQTFLTPRSTYELDLPSDMLAPFHTSNTSPHPDPAIFDQLAVETQKRLKESLSRFVSAQFNNVGNNRVLCGLIAGTFCCLVGALLPIVYNLSMGQSRWLRLTSLPGLWLGITLLISSLNGICLGVYIFGDLRQLRKFELSRPSISKPKPLIYHSHPRTRGSFSNTKATTITTNFDTILPSPPPLAHIHTTGRDQRPVSSSSSASTSSLQSQAYSAASSSTSLSITGSDAIHISQAYYDPDPIEGPATSPVSVTPVFVFPPKPKSAFDDDEDDEAYEGRISDSEESDSGSFGLTADFIHQYQYEESDDDATGDDHYAECRQRVSPFDFDGLPPFPVKPGSVNSTFKAAAQPNSVNERARSHGIVQQHSQSSLPKPSFLSPIHRHPIISSPLSRPQLPSIHPTPSVELITPEPEVHDRDFSFKGFMRRIQSRCNINKWLVIASSTSSIDLDLDDDGDEKSGARAMHLKKDLEAQTHDSYNEKGRVKDEDEHEYHSNFPRPHPSSHIHRPQHSSNLIASAARMQHQFKLVKAVPAFASPLTKVLSPIVVRGQWEIVMHSMVVACLVSWVVVGCLLAVPVPNVH
ncbi:hypothetical protein D9758_002659 [Tetrapyrgos nigripes]|uniref:Transmembrane protein n=1 Tax=Tetrapyrgos nigripes TaxID=182062 RepID=A0A8H5LTM5_9AGAR|nr:hypothetical protein D9758_002659 [Tetrapyrgos nigripes]